MQSPDLRHLKPAELVRLANSTPLGKVTTTRVLGEHRNEAGYQIGDAKTIDLVRYAAWLAVRHHKPKDPEPEGTAYERKKDAARQRSVDASLSGRDIYPMPEVVNPARKSACERDFRLFCETYHPQTFYLAWSEDHLKVLEQVQTSVLDGGLFATAMPRGSGKTSICECACEWSVLYGHRAFVPLIGADEKNALQMLESIKTEFEGNDLLLEDFPEVVYPIRCLDGISLRAKGQLFKGVRTQIGWTNDEIMMPTIPGSKASGAVIRVGGITGGLRGMKVKRPDGKTMRPDLILVDDPQTDSSSRSPSQCHARERILAGAILGLAGPGRKIAGLMPCTVISDGDMADSILDRDKHPEWNGTRTQMVYSFPANEKLWAEYGRIRADSLRAEHGGREATEFYRANREAMDLGAKVAWEARFDPDELSAIQHAMNLLTDRGEDAFWAEYQNRPRKPEVARFDDLTADQIAARVNRMRRGLVPIACNRVTAMIDVQATLLFYTVVAWEDDFTGYIIDYGSYPDQKRPYFTLRDAKIKLEDVIKATGLEGHIYGGLEKLTEQLIPREWLRDDGAMLKIEGCPIDANWGTSTDTIYKFCRQSPFSGVLMPSHGRYVGAASVPMREYQKKPGDRVGLNWRIPNVQGKRAVRYVVYDTNFWKGFVHARLSVGMGDRGGLSIFGDKAEQHAMFADHLCAEYRVRTQGRGREVDEFKLRPDRPDNHWLDCYDEETEALTHAGWKPFSEIDASDELATVNLETDHIEYQRPTSLIARHHRGEMVRIGGEKFSRLDMLVTPNHRMVVFEGQASRGPAIKEAGDLSIWDKIKTTATWEGDGRKTYLIPATGEPRVSRHGACMHCKRTLGSFCRGLCWSCFYETGVKERYPKRLGRRKFDEVEVDAKDLAGFLGWYVAEGSCVVRTAKGKGKTHKVVISQNPGQKQDEICSLLDRLPWKYHRFKKGVVVSNEQAYNLVRDLGNKYSKTVPQWIKDAGTDVINEFIRCAVNGDGWRSGGDEAYATVSRKLADDMMELYLKAGFAVSSRLIKAKAYSIRGHSGGAERTQEQHHVYRKLTDRCYLRDSKNRPNFRRVPYDGMVYCASVPNGTLIVRRNGKVAVCGNCLAGSAMAASMQGVALPEQAETAKAKKPKLSFSELQRLRRERPSGTQATA